MADVRSPPHPGPILYRSIAWEAAIPTCLALVVLTLLVSTKGILAYSELIINRGAAPALIAQLVLFQTLPVLAQMLPFATLIGGMVGLGRMASDLEIVAIFSLGVNPRQVIAPIALFGIGVAVLGVVLSTALAPWANRGFDRSMAQIAEIDPTASITPGTARRFGDWKLEAQEVSSGGGALQRVLLWVPSLGETVFAESAEIYRNADANLEIKLSNGVVLLDPRGMPRTIRFEQMVTTLPRDEILAASGGNELAGLSQSALAASSRDSSNLKRTVEARSELHRRFALPTAAALFSILAAQLTLLRRRASRGSGAVLGISITIMYYGLVQLAEGVAQRYPGLAVPATWLPNVVMLVVVGFFYWRVVGAWTGTITEQSKTIGSSWNWITRHRRVRQEIKVRSHSLSRYVMARFVQMSMICFVTLAAGYLFIDVLERLQWFARHAATADEIFRFYGARIPLLVSRVMPMGLLVAMALTVGLLTREGELLGMRTCGISGHKALRPTLVVCILIAPLSLFLNDQIVPRTNALADVIKQRDIKDNDDHRNAVWRTNGKSLFQLMNLDLGLGTAADIVLYELGADGLPNRRTDARSARYVGSGRWQLQDTMSIASDSSGGLYRTNPLDFAILGDRPSDELDLMHLSILEVRALIHEFQLMNASTAIFEVDLYAKLATPLSCILLPALILIFALQGPPFPNTSLTLISAGALSVVYTLATGAFASFGRSGVLPTWVGGWGPSLIAGLVLVGLYVRSIYPSRT